MTGRDLNSFGFVVFFLGLLVAFFGPFLSGGKGHDSKNMSFNWYIWGALAMGVGACIMLR